MFPLDQPLHRRPRQIFSSITSSFDSGESSFATSESISSSDPAFSPSSFSSDFSATTSESERSTSRTVASSFSIFSVTSESDTLSTATPTSLFTSFTSSFETLTTAPPSSSSPSSTTSPEPSTPSSGFVLSTFTSSFVSDINGSPTTIVTPIVTSLRSSQPSGGSSRTALIVGSAVAGTVVLIIVLATLFVVRRRVRRQRYWALSRKRLPSRTTFLAGEEMDLPFPSPPFASADHDDPFGSRSIHRINSAGSGGGGGNALGMGLYTQSFDAHSQSSHAHGAGPSSYSPPRLLRARASESGSIFQEGVWPPPASQLMDPLTSPSQSVDLARVVTDVMGPQAPPETGPLLSSSIREHEWEHEPERGQEGPERERGPILRPLSLAIAPTNLDERPRSPSDSQPQIQPSTPSPPLTPPPRLPGTRWLNRSPNPSPKGSPLHQTQPI